MFELTLLAFESAMLFFVSLSHGFLEDPEEHCTAKGRWSKGRSWQRDNVMEVDGSKEAQTSRAN